MPRNSMKITAFMFINMLFMCPILKADNKSWINGNYAGNIIINNLTNQTITNIEYWIGKPEDAENPGLIMKAKGSIEKDNHVFNFSETFNNKKLNTLVVKATLEGGGYIKSKYSISKDQKQVELKLSNKAVEVPGDNFNSVMEKFKQFKFDGDFLRMNDEDALLSLLGSLYLYDKDEKVLLYMITAKELHSSLQRICKQNNSDQAQGIFSSSTVAQGGINLPFVNGKSDFTSCDIVKYSWSVENVGECLWTPPNQKDLATLFSELPTATKDVLLRIYNDNPGSKLKFINKIFVIGRIDVENVKSQHVNSNSEITGSSFVSAKGNYNLVNDFSTKTTLSNVVTKADGYFVTGLLANEYLLRVAAATSKLAEADNARIRSEFLYLLNKYPKILTPTDDIEIMKKQIVDLNKQVGGINYVNTPEGNSQTNLTLLAQSPDPATNSKMKIESFK